MRRNENLDVQPDPAGLGDRACTISIVSHGQIELVVSLLDDLARLRPAAVKRIVVTLNVPESFDPPDAFPFELSVLRNEAPHGYGANHNRAFFHCDTPVFIVSNPDIRLVADPFPALMGALRRGCGIAAPAVTTPAGALEDNARPLLTPADLVRRTMGRRASDPSNAAWFAGMFLAFDAAVYEQLGGFDERFFMYCEDADICARSVLAGRPIAYCAEASVVHDARRSSRRALRPLLWHVRSLLRLWTSAAFLRYLRHRGAD